MFKQERALTVSGAIGRSGFNWAACFFAKLAMCCLVIYYWGTVPLYAQGKPLAVAYCTAPTPNQLHTLLALASVVNDTFSLPDCDRLYQKLYRLKDLNLENKEIEDLSPLSGLVGLEKLILDNNRIRNLTPLAGLVNLKKLFLVNNQLTDLAPLTTLIQLETLYLTDNQLTDISPLQNLKHLNVLFLSGNRIDTLSPLRLSSRLTWLIADHNRISDISGLKRLTSLKRLDLTGNPLSEVGAIARFPNFKQFRLPDTISMAQKSSTPSQSLRSKPISTKETQPKPVIAEISPAPVSKIPAKPKLEGAIGKDVVARQVKPGIAKPQRFVKKVEPPDLSFDNEPRVEPKPETLIAKLIPVEPISPRIKVPEYHIGTSPPLLCKSPTKNQEWTLTVLAEKAGIIYSPDKCKDLYQRLNKLIMLIVQGKQLSDLSPLESLTNLNWLFLYNNRITDVSPLRNMGRLRSLGLDSNQIEDITPLAGLQNLTSLSLHNNKIRDISSLQNLKNLTSLSLHNNQISNLNPLRSLVLLTTLKLNYNEIDDLTPLEQLSQLTELHLKQNRIKDIDPLKSLFNLKRLDLRLNTIEDYAPIQTLEHFAGFMLPERSEK
jgi:internalin A